MSKPHERSAEHCRKNERMKSHATDGREITELLRNHRCVGGKHARLNRLRAGPKFGIQLRKDFFIALGSAAPLADEVNNRMPRCLPASNRIDKRGTHMHAAWAARSPADKW